jgi:gamma-aminobutyric acid type B receptor
MYRFDRCFSEYEAIWLSLVIGYKFILQAIGAFLAFNIRKVKIRGLNDSREISAILYITTILTVIVATCNFLFGDYINVDGTVYGVCVCTSTTCVLAFIFVPKVCHTRWFATAYSCG